MASLSHVAVGFAAARAHDGAFRWRTMVALAAFSMLPDADVIAFKFGIPYESQWGHRGFTHSIVFAVFCGAVAWLVTKKSWKSTLALFVVVLTHPFLDSLTDGGLGVALFWPVTDARYFAPWTPIPVAPIGMGMLSRYGAYVLFAELAIAVPLLAAAHFLPRRARET